MYNCTMTMKVVSKTRRAKLPVVHDVEAELRGRLLYFWMQDGRSGMLDLSNSIGHLPKKWDEFEMVCALRQQRFLR